MEITVTVNAPELAGAIAKLALAIDGIAAVNKDGYAVIPSGTTATVQNVEMQQPTQAAQTVQTVQTVQQPTQTAQAVQTAQTVQQPSKAITLNDLATAGAGIVDQGKMQQVISLLGKYGVQAITQLPPDSFEAFAAELRTLGANI